MLKCQQFKDGENNLMKPKPSKRPCVDAHDNEERQSLNNYQDRGD